MRVVKKDFSPTSMATRTMLAEWMAPDGLASNVHLRPIYFKRGGLRADAYSACLGLITSNVPGILLSHDIRCGFI